MVTSSQGKRLADGTVDVSEKGPAGLPKRTYPNPVSFMFWLWVGDFVGEWITLLPSPSPPLL